jgi:hypothetical protein
MPKYRVTSALFDEIGQFHFTAASDKAAQAYFKEEFIKNTKYKYNNLKLERIIQEEISKVLKLHARAITPGELEDEDG